MSLILKKIKYQIDFFLTQKKIPKLNYQFEKNKNLLYGDYACNVLLILKQWVKKNQVQINFSNFTNQLITTLQSCNIQKIDYQEPGFLNFFFHPNVLNDLSIAVFTEKDQYGQQPKKNQLYYTELVSANPTGLLHIGHARNGVFADALNNLLKTAGYQVYAEYLINDSGNQIQQLSQTMLYHYLNLCGEQLTLKSDHYQGQEVYQCADAFYQLYGDQYYHQILTTNYDHDRKWQRLFGQFGVEHFLKKIRYDLNAYQINIDHWFSEQTMHNNNELQQVFQILKADLYQANGATWFKASKYIPGIKDEVVIKSDGTTTYYAQDLAYHLNKLKKFNLKNTILINVFGADHHGHIDRMKAFLLAMGYQLKNVIFLTTQLVRLVKDGQEIKLSKRTGQTLTMQTLLSMMGYDAVRWYLVSQSIDSHIEIDLNKLTLKNASNQVYYVLYAYARIWQVLLKLPNYQFVPNNFILLTNNHERMLINHLLGYQSMIVNAAKTFEPHRICNYLYELAKLFHVFYNENQILNSDHLQIQTERLGLIYIIQQIIHNGLGILKIKPEKKI